MSIEYDNYYQTENLFGAPYPELLKFYSSFKEKGKLLDLGCGQGRDAIALARLGFEVTAIDHSKVGIKQLNRIAETENLSLKGVVDDMYEYAHFEAFDYILLDSLFHFGKRERTKEKNFLLKIIYEAKPKALITICIQKTGKKLEILMTLIENCKIVTLTNQTELVYIFEDKESGHKSQTDYAMITIEKIQI